MKAICDGLNLSIAVGNVSKAISGRTTAPVLEGIKIKAEKDYLILTATDTEIAIEQKIPAEVFIEGEIVVPGKYFLDFIRKLNNEQIELSLINNNCLKIRYNDSEGILQCLKADEFPAFDKLLLGDTFSLIQKELKDLIQKTVFCAAVEDFRPILKGVLFQIDDYQVTAVSLDGYRLALVKKPIEQTSTKVNIVIPARSLIEISKLLNNDEN
ncbi:MAG: DNA polymerase III subunit beta, partial [Clostridia bacterium]